MIYLILSILSSTLIFVIFKLFDKFKIDTFQAIVANYITATCCGLISYDGPVELSSVHKMDWFYGAVLLGIIFITVFNLMAATTQRNGLSVAAVATKMSVAIPVIFGIILYKESTGIYKIAGIIIAIIAVYLTAMKNPKGVSIKAKNIVFPILVFIGSGFIDTTLKYLETKYVDQNDIPIFSASIFFFAAVAGLIIMSYQIIFIKKKINLYNLLAGFMLGIPNYFSIYFLIKALRQTSFDSSSIFPINNVGILIVTTLVGMLIFKEKLLIKNWIGIAIAIVSIILIAFSTQS